MASKMTYVIKRASCHLKYCNRCAFNLNPLPAMWMPSSQHILMGSQVPTPLLCSSLSTSAHPTKTTSSNNNRTGSMQDVEISPRLRMFRPGHSDAWPYSVHPEKVLVVFLPWLNAQEKHVNKYLQLYLDLGLDVLCVKSNPKDFLWPPSSFNLATELAQVLNEHQQYEHLVFHSLSIGSYNLTTFRILGKEVKEVAALNQKIRGIIYDSIVIGAGRGGALDKSGNENEDKNNQEEDNSKAIDRFVKGMADSVKGGQIILPLLSVAARVYFSLTKKQTLDYYEKAYSVVRDEPAQVPTLVYASKNDPMCDKEVVEMLVDMWKQQHRVPVHLQMWDKSGHAQHLSFHRKEYMDLQRKFLDQLFGDESRNKNNNMESRMEGSSKDTVPVARSKL